MILTQKQFDAINLWMLGYEPTPEELTARAERVVNMVNRAWLMA